MKHDLHGTDSGKTLDYSVITEALLCTCHSSMLIALSSCTSLVSRCID